MTNLAVNHNLIETKTLGTVRARAHTQVIAKQRINKKQPQRKMQIRGIFSCGYFACFSESMDTG